MSHPAANCHPVVRINALPKSFITLRFLDSCFSKGRAVSAFPFGELRKFGNVRFSKSRVHCHDLTLEDCTLAIYLVHRTFCHCFLVGRLFWSCSWSTPVPIEFDAGSRSFWWKRTRGIGGQCTLSPALLYPWGISSIPSTPMIWSNSLACIA